MKKKIILTEAEDKCFLNKGIESAIAQSNQLSAKMCASLKKKTSHRITSYGQLEYNRKHNVWTVRLYFSNNTHFNYVIEVWDDGTFSFNVDYTKSSELDAAKYVTIEEFRSK